MDEDVTASSVLARAVEVPGCMVVEGRLVDESGPFEAGGAVVDVAAIVLVASNELPPTVVALVVGAVVEVRLRLGLPPRPASCKTSDQAGDKSSDEAATLDVVDGMVTDDVEVPGTASRRASDQEAGALAVFADATGAEAFIAVGGPPVALRLLFDGPPSADSGAVGGRTGSAVVPSAKLEAAGCDTPSPTGAPQSSSSSSPNASSGRSFDPAGARVVCSSQAASADFLLLVLPLLVEFGFRVDTPPPGAAPGATGSAAFPPDSGGEVGLLADVVVTVLVVLRSTGGVPVVAAPNPATEAPLCQASGAAVVAASRTVVVTVVNSRPRVPASGKRSSRPRKDPALNFACRAWEPAPRGMPTSPLQATTATRAPSRRQAPTSRQRPWP